MAAFSYAAISSAKSLTVFLWTWTEENKGADDQLGP
jgi:hypothetical protein